MAFWWWSESVAGISMADHRGWDSGGFRSSWASVGPLVLMGGRGFACHWSP